MSNGVKLLSLAIQDVGELDERIDLGPFGAGLTVVSGLRRAGRATLVAALRAALLERHDDRHEGIKALQAPGTRSGPEIWMELTVDGERVSVHKRFLERPLAEVRFHGEGVVFTGAKAEEVVRARLAGLEPRASGDRAAKIEDPVAATLDLAALHAELTAQLGAVEGNLAALEDEWKAAVAAEYRAHELERDAQEAELRLANAEALFDAVHREIAALRAIAPDELLKSRHAAALAALGPAHRSARSAALVLDDVAPHELRGATLRARGAITACTLRACELRIQARAVKAWIDRTAVGPRLGDLADAPLAFGFGWLTKNAREQLAVVVRLAVARMISRGEGALPLFVDDTLGWNDDGRFLAMVQMLREAPGAPQIIVLTAHASRFQRLQVDHAADLDQLRDERRRALGLDRISG